MITNSKPEHGKYPIDRPCSACSAGDYKMEYHDHDAPFREGFGPVADKHKRVAERLWKAYGWQFEDILREEYPE